MIIGIDGNEANVERRVGISEYAFELLRYFKEFTTSPDLIKVHSLWFIVYLKDNPLPHMPEWSENWQYRIVGPKMLWTQFGLPLHLFFDKPRPNIFFSPTHYAPRISPVPTAVAIMDLSYIHFPEMFTKKDLFQLIHWTAYSAKQAEVIFTISQSSKRDILKYYQVPEERVIVTYPGIKQESVIMKQESGIEEIKNKYGISDKYVLFVGTIQPRKNIERLIKAFDRVLKEDRHTNLQLIIVGKRGWLYESILKRPKELGIEEKVIFLNFVPDEELDILYRNALCFCLPSLYEGFGLPVLEAMKRGCPVITSKVSSLPEAGGEAALYFNPESVEDIAEKITELINNESLREKFIQKGFEQVKKFSWKKTAQETLELLQEVAKVGKI